MNSRRCALFFGILLLAAGSASAQSRDPYFSTLSANYDLIYHEEDTTSAAGAHFDVASTFKRSVPFIGPVGEVGFNHFDGANIVSVLGGLRVRIPNIERRVLPYAQVLLGLYHCGSCLISDFAIQGGGGIDFRVSDGDLRVRTQLDVRHVFYQPASFNAVRLSIGIVVPLNK